MQATMHATSTSEVSVPAIPGPFTKLLIELIRAEDSFGTWGRKSDVELLDDFVLSNEARRALPMMADPDPDAVHRVEQFYRSAALLVEQRTGLVASPMMTLHHEGFGRLILTVGRLVAFSKTLREIHRFGFDSLVVLEDSGQKVVEQTLQAIERYSEVARV
jgi:probable nitrogen fixation protein